MTDVTAGRADTPEASDEASGSRLRWEIPEVLSIALLVAFAVTAAVNVAAGIVEGVGVPPQSTTDGISEILFRATQWAQTPIFGLLLLGALGLAWWQVQGWGEVADASDESSTDAPSPDELRSAFDYLNRAKALATGAMLLLVVLALGAVGATTSIFRVFAGENIGRQLLAEEVTSTGEAVATLVLVAAGVFAAQRLRRNVSAAFASTEADGVDDSHPVIEL